jgi:hypothetical protein
MIAVFDSRPTPAGLRTAVLGDKLIGKLVQIGKPASAGTFDQGTDRESGRIGSDPLLATLPARSWSRIHRLVRPLDTRAEVLLRWVRALG